MQAGFSGVLAIVYAASRDLHNLKYMKNTHRGVLFLVKLQDSAFFTFFNLFK